MIRRYPNCSMCSEDLIPDDGELCGACAKAVSATAKEMIAAAEERGRRRGVEEGDELRTLLRDCGNALRIYLVAPSRRDEVDALLAKIDAALAPRDSGKEG